MSHPPTSDPQEVPSDHGAKESCQFSYDMTFNLVYCKTQLLTQ